MTDNICKPLFEKKYKNFINKVEYRKETSVSMSDARRGFTAEDEIQFNNESQTKLRRAQQDILYLIEKGYPIKNASVFVGNHYMLSERQRLAIVRASAESNILKQRLQKKLTLDTLGKKAVIDGLNIIITLEVALSEGILIRCMDQTIRDLAGLRGTYRLIGKTDEAIRLIGNKLAQMKVGEVLFYLDAPVSNTGRLKTRILDLLKEYPFLVGVELVHNADIILEKLDNVITSDAIILNKCISWFNLTAQLLQEELPGLKIVDLS
jgi:hypothetical protein